MADYIYLLENRLSPSQQSALGAVREIARAKGLTVFLVGGAVRDLTSGSPVRDLDLAVQGNALKLRKDLEKAGAQIAGEYEPTQTLYVRFPGAVRMEVSSALSATWPKPGRPVYKPAAILDDLRRRDFTANAMALSLNEGSYGLLMDPLNGVADIENRELRLVSNYGFIEEPVRMIRAQRLGARLGWQLEEKTQGRYEAGKAEGYISTLSEFHRGYELEEIVHEEDPFRVLQRLEFEGWMTALFPSWTTAKVNVNELEKLREVQGQLQMQGILADASAAQFPLLTAKMAPKDVASLKESFPRQGFVQEIDALEGEGKQFAAELSSRQAATPSGAWRTIFRAPPEVVLWVAYSTRSAALQAKFKSFYSEWPAARQRIPYALMQEMRIVPELAGFNELVEKVFFELMDARLGTTEEMKAFLEPHSPPAPPPPVNMRRPRGAKGPRAGKGRKRPEADAAAEEGSETDSPETFMNGSDDTGVPEELDSAGADSREEGPGSLEAKDSTRARQVAAPAKSPGIRPVKAPAEKKGGTPAEAAPVKGGAKLAEKTASKAAQVGGKKPVAAKTGPVRPAKEANGRKPAGKAVAASSKKPAKTAAKATGKPAKDSGKASAKATKQQTAKAVTGKGLKASAGKGKPAPAKKSVAQKKAKKR